jgi:hypothetical protein
MVKQALFLIVAGVVAAAAGAEDMYKWVDDQGQLHFGSRPPAGVKAQKMAPSAAEPAVAAPTPAWRQELEQSNLRHLHEQQQKEQDAKAQQQRARRCLAARQEFDILNKGRPIYRVDSQGEREYMSDEQRQAAIASANQRVVDNCR